MLDQAYDLRRLATRCEAADSPRCGGRAALVVVAGGKGGVGTTTVAIGLATAVANSGHRTLLVDADSRGGDLAWMCGIEERYTLADVLTGRRAWNETICAGPAGVGVVAGQRGWHGGRTTMAVAGRLLEQLGRQDLPAEAVVIDAGSGLDGVAAHVCRKADAVLMVSSVDAAAVIGAFTGIKALLAASDNSGQPPPLHLLVNMAPSARVAEIVHHRLARTCRRLLGIGLQSAGWLATATHMRISRPDGIIGLSLQVDLVDTIRGVSEAKALSI